MEWKIASYVLVVLAFASIAKHIHDTNDSANAAWSKWSSANCTVLGNRVVPVFLDWNASVVIYKCKDGTTREARPGRAPDGWESMQSKQSQNEADYEKID